jgi:hypothetical protein
MTGTRLPENTVLDQNLKQAWLVCPRCETKEAITRGTKFVHCTKCGSPRHSEDGDGRPLVSWSIATSADILEAL